MTQLTTLMDMMNGGIPFRYYYEEPHQRGKIRPLLFVGAEWNEIPNTNGDRINPKIIRSILRDYQLEKLDTLAESMAFNLQLMKETKHWPDTLPDGFANPVVALQRSIPKLLPAAEDVAAALHHVLAEPDCPDRPRRTALLSALAAFVKSSDAIMELTNQTGTNKSTAHWHDDAYFLAIELYNEARLHGVKIPLSKYDSVGVKVIDNFLNLASVNHSGPDAIAKELNRRRTTEPFLRSSP